MGAFEGLPFVRIVCVSAFVAAAMLKQVLVLLAAARAVVIDYYFGAECPGCRAFGSSSLPKLFAAFNATDTLRVVPAVRSVGGNCVDEKGCDAEKTIACAMKLCGATLAGATNGCAVDFVACADETDWSTAPKLAAACAAKAGVSADDVMTCFASSEATDLLTAVSYTHLTLPTKRIV